MHYFLHRLRRAASLLAVPPEFGRLGGDRAGSWLPDGSCSSCRSFSEFDEDDRRIACFTSPALAGIGLRHRHGRLRWRASSRWRAEDGPRRGSVTRAAQSAASMLVLVDGLLADSLSIQSTASISICCRENALWPVDRELHPVSRSNKPAAVRPRALRARASARPLSSGADRCGPDCSCREVPDRRRPSWPTLSPEDRADQPAGNALIYYRNKRSAFAPARR